MDVEGQREIMEIQSQELVNPQHKVIPDLFFGLAWRDMARMRTTAQENIFL